MGVCRKAQNILDFHSHKTFFQLCNKSFKHDVSRTNHMRTAHNIVITVSETHVPKQLSTFTEQKSGSNPITLPQTKSESTFLRHEAPTDLSFLPLHSRKAVDSNSGPLSQEALKMESPLVSSTEALMLDESDTVPYNVTSRMVQK